MRTEQSHTNRVYALRYMDMLGAKCTISTSSLEHNNPSGLFCSPRISSSPIGIPNPKLKMSYPSPSLILSQHSGTMQQSVSPARQRCNWRWYIYTLTLFFSLQMRHNHPCSMGYDYEHWTFGSMTVPIFGVVLYEGSGEGGGCWRMAAKSCWRWHQQSCVFRLEYMEGFSRFTPIDCNKS